MAGIITVTTKEQLDYLYDQSAPTLEGLTLDSVNDFYDYVKSFAVKETKDEVFVISGKTMNEQYELTGTNAYPENLNIISIPFDNFEGFDVTRFAIQRFGYGVRWFDDIVDNNICREYD